MATVHLLVGIPGSGKSTFSKRLNEKENIRIVSSDTIRNLHPDWEESKIFPEVYRLLAEYLSQGIDCIYDATNATEKVRRRFFDKMEQYNVKFDTIAYYFPIKFKDCKKRVRIRNKIPTERYFPLNKLRSYYKSITVPTLEEGFKDVVIVPQKNLKVKKS